MIRKEQAFCTERRVVVEALLEETRVGKAKTAQKVPLACTRMGECAKTAFCRFVNPLTMRVPLQMIENSEKAAS
jgi:hypothetical protein